MSFQEPKLLLPPLPTPLEKFRFLVRFPGACTTAMAAMLSLDLPSWPPCHSLLNTRGSLRWTWKLSQTVPSRSHFRLSPPSLPTL